MNKQQAILIAGALFPTYPSVKAFHITHDGQAFEKEHDAAAHARSFQKKEEQDVLIVTRDEFETGSGDSPLDKAQAALKKEKFALSSLEASAEKAKNDAAREKILKTIESQREKVAAAEQAVLDLEPAE